MVEIKIVIIEIMLRRLFLFKANTIPYIPKMNERFIELKSDINCMLPYPKGPCEDPAPWNILKNPSRKKTKNKNIIK